MPSSCSFGCFSFFMPVCFKRQEYFSYAFFTCRGNHIRLSASISLFMFVCLLLCAKQFHVPFVSSLAFFFFFASGLLVSLQHFMNGKNVRVSVWRRAWLLAKRLMWRLQLLKYWKGLFFLLNKTLYSFKFVKWAIGRICRKVYPLNILGNPFLQLHICFISLVVCNSWTAFNAKNMQNSVFPHRKNKGG